MSGTVAPPHTIEFVDGPAAGEFHAVNGPLRDTVVYFVPGTPAWASYGDPNPTSLSRPDEQVVYHLRKRVHPGSHWEWVYTVEPA